MMNQPGSFGQPQQEAYNYEFKESENAVIGSTANWCIALGVIEFLNAAGSLLGSQHSVLGAAVSVGMGLLFIYAANAFRRVVTTQGQDIQNLMSALTNLGTVFLVRIIAICIIGVVMVLAAFAVMAVAASKIH
jgi:hypothetical protein